MKRFFAFLMVAIMVVTLCACSKTEEVAVVANDSLAKYVGTYECKMTTGYGMNCDTWIKKTMILDAGGVGNEKIEVYIAGEGFEKGQVLSTSEITWSVQDEYLIVNYTESKNYETNKYYQGGYGGMRSWEEINLLNEPKISTYAETYELKGTGLYDIQYGTCVYTKLMG